MRILLVSLNRETEPFTAAPLGMALVGASLAAEGHEVRSLDLLFSADPGKQLKEAVTVFGPELVGLSLRNIESSTAFLLPSYRDTMAAIMGATDAPVVIGGPGFSVMPSQVMGYLGADYGIVGEGELAMVRLALALQEGRDPSDIPGICCIKGGTFSLTPPERITTLDELPPPAWTGLPVESYDMVGVQSKRGCSFSCAYCTYPALEGRRMRLISPELVVRDMDRLTREGVSAFYLVDNVFNNPREHALGICRALIEQGVKAHWGCLASPIGLDGELLGAMSRAGCESVEIGADSLSDRALKGLGKPFKASDVIASVRACKDAGMAHMLFLILGGPGEDEDTLRETFDALDSISPDKVFAVAGVRVYPGTPIQKIAVESGAVHKDDSLLEPRFYVSEKLGDRLYGVAEEYFSKRPGWIYYRANAIQDARPVPAAQALTDMDGRAEACLSLMLGEVPRLMRPIARRAVIKKAGRLALERGLSCVSSAEVVDAFLAETPGPFRSAMEKSLRKHGFIA